MGEPAQARATYEDVLNAPPHKVAELIHGSLRLSPRPASPHAVAASVLTGELGQPFARGRGGPGGWLILMEPELHLSADVLVPDLAGWRRERMSHTGNVPYFTLAPDWLCEVASPSTEKMDRSEKLPIYAREGIKHVWIVEPLRKTLEVFALQQGRWSLVSVHKDDDRVRAEPFDAIELDLALLWADVG